MRDFDDDLAYRVDPEEEAELEQAALDRLADKASVTPKLARALAEASA